MYRRAAIRIGHPAAKFYWGQYQTLFGPIPNPYQSPHLDLFKVHLKLLYIELPNGIVFSFLFLTQGKFHNEAHVRHIVLHGVM